jgi:hypothetical protein
MTIRGFAVFLAAFLIAGAAAACPNYNLYGDTYHLNGADLYNAQSVRVRAGGSESILGCGIRFGSERGRGYVTEAPDFSINLSGMQRYSIVFSVVSECDSILLINTGAANWYYDDDDNGNLDARISLSRPSNGWMDIWVGTHNGTYCDAVLTIETFYR